VGMLGPGDRRRRDPGFADQPGEGLIHLREMACGFLVHPGDYNQAVAASPFTILLEDDVPVDPRKYGALVAPALGLTQVEARMAVRKGRGIFLENLAEDDARR